MDVDLIRLALLAFLLAAATAAADEADEATAEAEISFLISAIGNSGCDFIRNGKR